MTTQYTRPLIKLPNGRILEWSLTLKAPLSWDLTLEELPNYLARKYGRRVLTTLPERLKSLHVRLTDHPTLTVFDVIKDNKAGTYGECLLQNQLQEKYTRNLFEFSAPFNGIQPGTRCRVWSSKAGHLPLASNKTHVKLGNQRDVFDVPWEVLENVD